MKNHYLKLIVLGIVILSFAAGYSQGSDSPWTPITESSVSQVKIRTQEPEPENATFYRLDMALLKSKLQHVPEGRAEFSTDVLLDFPKADGTFEVFKITESPIMAPALQAKFPEIRSYVGHSLTKTSTVIYFSVSPEGLHSMTGSPDNGTEFINPHTSIDTYKAFSRKEVITSQNVFECDVIDDSIFDGNSLDTGMLTARNANDGTRRTYRLAIGTSVEFTDFHGGTVASALAAINTIMTRVNGVFDRELSIRMVLVDDNDLLISTTGNSLFSNTENVRANTGIINGLIGEDNYDIGHSFTTGSGGMAYVSSVCSVNKGGGTTGLSSPQGDIYAIDYVSHEMGHQFGATHTFNGNADNCRGTNRYGGTAYEPGSGSTIMSYAGLCSPQNIQYFASDYFHQASLAQIWAYVTTGGGSCGTLTSTGNTAPTANAGLSYSIPKETPYRLTGASTDVDGTDSHTYTWEQYDLGPTGAPSPTSEFGPLVRSFKGTATPVRYIPRLHDIITYGGTNSSWEKLASIDRELNFVLTVRDNDPRGGQTAVDEMTVTVVADAGPFMVTSQDDRETWEVGSYKNITWNVANTDQSPINVSHVNILLSTDGGLTFPHVLASHIPNNGSHQIVVPTGITSNNARIMVESVDNIFFNINTARINIVDVDFLLNFSTVSNVICQPEDAVYEFTYNAFKGFHQNTIFSATGLPSGAVVTFQPDSAIADGTSVTMTVSHLGDVPPGSYEILVTGTSGTIINNSTVQLDVFGMVEPVSLLAPANGATGLYNEVTFIWEEDINVESYFIEISTDADFNTVFDTHYTTNTSYSASLELSNEYYWRVTGTNLCSSNVSSLVHRFSTGMLSCGYTKTSVDTPVAISPVGSNTYNATIVVNENLPIVDVNVKVNITHAKTRDLTLWLISPSGTKTFLAEHAGGVFGEDYINTVFDQEADIEIRDGASPFTGSFKPEGDLSQFYGELSGGNWTLEVNDYFTQDGGSLDEFTLEFCFAKPLSTNIHHFENFAIFPNPSTGEFTVKLFSHSGNVINVNVYDVRGRKIFENSFVNTANFREIIRLDNVMSGLYLITVSDGNYKAVKKMIIERR